LRFFAGLSREEAAQVLGVSIATADNDWAYAKGWLQVELSQPGNRE
jgi:DNA-directed RNA polymerase specialized sigma24 family protein